MLTASTVGKSIDFRGFERLLLFRGKWLATCRLVVGNKRARLLIGRQSGPPKELGVGEIHRCLPNKDWLFLKGQAVPIIDDAYALTDIAKVFHPPIAMTKDELSGAT